MKNFTFRKELVEAQDDDGVECRLSFGRKRNCEESIN